MSRASYHLSTFWSIHIALLWLKGWVEWRLGLAVVQPKIAIHGYRPTLRLFWWWPSKRGRSQMLVQWRALIRQRAYDNSMWGQARTANALLRKLGLRVSSHTIRI